MNENRLLETEGTEREKMPEVFIGSVFSSMLERREKAGLVRTVLYSDIDNTADNPRSKLSASDLVKYLEEKNVPVVAVTGNNLPAVEKRIKAGELPYFQIISVNLGTEIYVLHKDENGNYEYKKDEDYEHLMRSKGFDRDKLAERGQKLIEDMSGKNYEWKLSFHKPDKEEGGEADKAPYRLGFDVHAPEKSLEEVTRVMSKLYPQQNVVICEYYNYNKDIKKGAPGKYSVDILAATKADPVNYISDNTRVELKITTGDNTPDLDMFKAGNISAIPGGARDNLIKKVKQEPGYRENKNIIRITDNTGRLIPCYKGKSLGAESIAELFGLIDGFIGVKGTSPTLSTPINIAAKINGVKLR